MLQRRIDAAHLRVRFRVDQARKAVAGAAADALALVRVSFVSITPSGVWNGCRPSAAKSSRELLNARLVAHRRMRIRRARRRLGRVFAALAVDMIQMLGLRVVRLQIVIGDRPRRRNAAVMPELAEVFLAQTKQRRAVELRIAADVVVRVRMQLLAVVVAPDFLGVGICPRG